MDKSDAIQLIKGLISDGDVVRQNVDHFDAWQYKCRSVLGRIFGEESSQSQALMAVDYAFHGSYYEGEDAPRQAFQNGLERAKHVLQACIWEIEQFGAMRFQELVHSDLFSDMLEAAGYLLGESYRHPAAVMAGGVLEQHLRELCRKHGIDPTFVNTKGESKPKMLDAMNTELAKASAYGKIEQKEVTAWAGIRNAAAHGEYDEYDASQVERMIAGIREFIIRHPA